MSTLIIAIALLAQVEVVSSRVISESVLQPIVKVEFKVTPAKTAITKQLLSVGTHSHTCPKGHTWSHSDHSFGNRADHMCPICGFGPVWNQSTVKVQVTPKAGSNCPGGFCPAPSRGIIFRR